MRTGSVVCALQGDIILGQADEIAVKHTHADEYVEHGRVDTAAEMRKTHPGMPML